MRTRAGLARAEVAGALAMAVSTVRRIEVGERRTRRGTLQRLIDLLLANQPDAERARALKELEDLAGPALAPESPFIARIARRRTRRTGRKRKQRRETKGAQDPCRLRAGSLWAGQLHNDIDSTD